jgi:DNA-binding transcriptional regulator YhcF (GntR family)
MTQFFIDKNNKIPLYLQIKDQIKYFISTGSMIAKEQLPPVKVLAKTLGINFLTVRKAYQELEREGLAEIKHGEGTFISLNNLRKSEIDNSSQNAQTLDFSQKFAIGFRSLVDEFSRQGLDLDQAKDLTQKVFGEILRENSLPIIVFAECNQFQIKEISLLLEKELQIEVKPMLVGDLESELGLLVKEGKEIHVITTGFHVNEVRNSVGDLPVQIDVLITNLNPETRRELQNVGETANFGFICRDQESAVLYKDLLKAELGFNQINLTSCTIVETEKVQQILEKADVILTSPPVFEEVKKIANSNKPVLNLFERVDPMSLKVTKDRILGKRINA